MSAATKLLTYDDLLKTPDDGQRYEIIGGGLHVSPSPSFRHQMIAAELFRLIDQVVRANDLGVLLFAPLDVRLRLHDIVEPDLLFIRRERLDIAREQLVEGAPDLVVEVLSPSSRRRDRVPKMALYAEAGVPEYWIADPDSNDLTIYTLADGQYQPVETSEGILHSNVIPGLTIDLGALFS